MIQMGNNSEQASVAQRLFPYALIVFAALSLYLSTLYSYLLFHSLVEVAGAVVLLTVFVLAWNSRDLLDNHYILFLGISFLSAAAIELVHMFAYKGFGVFPGFSTNLPTQLWIAFRYVFCLSFLIAPVFITRRVDAKLALTIYSVITSLLFFSIFSGIFPDCFIEGKGLTPFKIYSEFIIIIILLASLVLLVIKRSFFDAYVLKMVALSLLSAIAAEAAFTRYFSVHGQANLIGHIFLFLSAAFIYRAIIVTGFKKPMAIIFRNLEQNEERLRRIAETSIDLIFQLDVTGKVVFCSPAVAHYGYDVTDVIGKEFSAFIANEDLGLATSSFKRAMSGEHIQALELRLLMADGTPYYAEINIAPIRVTNVIVGLQGISRDITARMEAEKKLQKFTIELQTANTALNMSRNTALNLMQNAIDSHAILEKTNEELSREIIKHKQTVAALSTSEQFNKAVLDTVGNLVVVLDTDGRIQRFNQACEAATGYTSAEVLGCVFWELLVPDEELDGVCQTWMRLQAGDFPNSHENHWIIKDGSRRLIAWTNTAIVEDGEIAHAVCAGLDITERNQIEKAVQAERQLLETIVNHIPAGIAVIEGSELRIQLVNPAYQAIAPGKEMAGKTLDQLWPETQHSFADICRQVLSTGEPYHAVNERNMIRRKPGGPLEQAYLTWSLFRVRLPGDEGWAILNTTWETTESMLVEEKLKESEALYRGIGESIDYGVWVCAPDGRNTYASESFLNLVGITQEECSNFGWGKVLHPDDAERTIAAWQECVSTGSKWDVEHRFLGKDGQWHHVLARGVPVRNEQGEITCWAGINLDISRIKQAEEQINASLSEKDVLLREIHHRVKNNLQVISSLVSLQADSLDDERMREVFGDVRDRVRTMALVHEKLYQTDNLAQLNFADYATSLLQYLWGSHGTLAEKVRLHLEIAPVVLPIEKAVPCGLVLNELAVNALKHAFPNGSGGEVTVGVKFDPGTESVCLWVRDNGIGFPKELDWRQSKSLGLRLVQILAGQLQGSVEKGTGPGTEFKITFSLKGLQA